MTEEGSQKANELEVCFAAIDEIVQEISLLTDTAYQQYSRLVEQVLSGRITEEREIERIMDGLVDLHIALFRLQFEETEDEEHHGY